MSIEALVAINELKARVAALEALVARLRAPPSERAREQVKKRG